MPEVSRPAERCLDKAGFFLHRGQVELNRNSLGKTVLVVVEDEENRHVLRLLCESEELEVVGEAVPLALRLEPDFVILDIMMPELDGQRTAEVLRALSPKTKIVAFSVLLEKAPSWADAYLNKERISELMPLLNTLIR
jgi:CheY-like chemotaxis protein